MKWLAPLLLLGCTSSGSKGHGDDGGSDTGSPSDTATSGPVDCDGGDLSGYHPDDVTLEAGCTYHISDDASFHGLLSIPAGVTIEFDPGAQLDDYGTLQASGTADQPIVLRGSTPGDGTWNGLWIQDYSTGNELHHVQIDGAGTVDGNSTTHTYASGGLDVVAGHEVLVDGLTVTGSAGYGMVLMGTLSPGSDGLSLSGAMGSLDVHSDSLGTVPLLDVTQDIWIEGYGENRDATWVSQPVPLHCEWGDLSVIKGTLTIEPNTILFGADAEMFVGANDPADLVATDVVMDASDPSVGWLGLSFIHAYSSASTITGGRISNGHGPLFYVDYGQFDGVVTVWASDDCALPTFSNVEIDSGGLADGCFSYGSGCGYQECAPGHFEGEGTLTCGQAELYYDPDCG